MHSKDIKKKTNTQQAKNTPMMITYTGEINGQFMSTDSQDALQLSNCITDEADAIFSVNFTAPNEVLHYPVFYINEAFIKVEVSADGQQLKGYPKSQYDTVQTLVNALARQLLILQGQNIVMDWDDKEFVRTNKLTLKFDREVTFQIKANPQYDDRVERAYYLSKIIGCIEDPKETEKNNGLYASKIYTSKQVNNDGPFLINFEKQTYTNIAKTLNITCGDINKYIYELKKQRFLALKATYSFSPGDVAQASNSFQVPINTDTLSCGIMCKLCDENYVPLLLEEPYTITLNLNTSQKVIAINQQKIQQEDLEEQQQASAIEQQKQAIEQQKQQAIQQEQQRQENQLQQLKTDNQQVQQQVLNLNPENFIEPLSQFRQGIFQQQVELRNQTIDLLLKYGGDVNQQLADQIEIQKNLKGMNNLQNANLEAKNQEAHNTEEDIKAGYNLLWNLMEGYKQQQDLIQQTYQQNKSMPFQIQYQILFQKQNEIKQIKAQNDQARQQEIGGIQNLNQQLISPTFSKIKFEDQAQLQQKEKEEISEVQAAKIKSKSRSRSQSPKVDLSAVPQGKQVQLVTFQPKQEFIDKANEEYEKEESVQGSNASKAQEAADQQRYEFLNLMEQETKQLKQNIKQKEKQEKRERLRQNEIYQQQQKLNQQQQQQQLFSLKQQEEQFLDQLYNQNQQVKQYYDNSFKEFMNKNQANQSQDRYNFYQNQFNQNRYNLLQQIVQYMQQQGYKFQ